MAEHSDSAQRTPGRVHLVSGAIAGLTSAVTLQPFDLLKTRMQQHDDGKGTNQKRSIRSELKKLKNLRELWRGAIPSCLRSSLGAGFYFTILSYSRNVVSSWKKEGMHSSYSMLPRLSHFENLACGFFGRAVAGILTMPVTVIKTRFESSQYKYNSIREGVKDIYFDGNPGRGSIKHFFKGSVVTLARDCPNAGLYILFYEWSKNEVMNKLVNKLYDGSNNNFIFTPPQVIHASSAIIASFMSTMMTAPFDTIKTRLQLASNNSKDGRASVATVIKEILSEGGVRALASGLSLRLSRKAIASGISWGIYEELIRINSHSVVGPNTRKLV